MKDDLNFHLRSIICTAIKEKDPDVDLTNTAKYPVFAQFTKGFFKRLKKDGRLDSDHVQSIPTRILIKMNILALNVHAILCADPEKVENNKALIIKNIDIK